MTVTRREFLGHMTAAGTVLAAPPLLQKAFADAPAKKLKILFLGGTGFLGPKFIELAIARGHEVTLANRGRRQQIFPDLEFIETNRIIDIEPGLTNIEAEVKNGRRWDVVIDTASVHQWVENSAKLLKDAADHYVFTSSLSAYAATDGARSEGDAVAEMPDDVADGIDRLPYDMTYYGAVKGRCEAAAERHFPGKALILRPGLIVGPRDFTHRFTYWPARVREGGAVLAPGTPDDPIMFIDVRDLADFMIHTVETPHYGIYNTNGPVEGGMTIGALLDACKAQTGSDAEFTWVDAEFLSERGVEPWAQMPVWIPPVGAYAGFHKTSVEKARAAGLRSRPVGEIIDGTLEWFDGWLPEALESRGFEYKPGENAPGITREREAEILAEWASRDS